MLNPGESERENSRPLLSSLVIESMREVFSTLYTLFFAQRAPEEPQKQVLENSFFIEDSNCSLEATEPKYRSRIFIAL